MRIALAQLNPTVGDIAGNTRLVIGAIESARRDRAELLVASELALIGYPPRDVLLREGVVEACESAWPKIADAAGDMTVLVGSPRRAAEGVRPFRNSVVALRRGEVAAIYDKRLLPGYDVFDEDRYFEPGQSPCVIAVGGRRIGLLICEDLWQARDVRAERRYDVEPVRETVALGCDLLVSLNASPFVAGKFERHVQQLRALAREHRLPIVSVNQVGGNDDLIFDGRALALDARGEVRASLPGWVSAVGTITLPPSPLALPAASSAPVNGEAAQGVRVEPLDDLFRALVLGVRDHVRKTGHTRAVLGLSGGIDSALTAVIAAAALGVEQVTGLILPSRFSSDDSCDDAMALAANLGLADCRELSIEPLHEAGRAVLAASLGERAGGLTDENVQARLRGLLLMGHANALGALVLATGNKSELATGYCTLYGDMCGAVAVLGDVLKTTVYELSQWINGQHAACGFPLPPIPRRSITRAPTAELRPDQTDQDTLPPYAVLDEIIRRFIELEQSPATIIAETKLDAALVMRWTRAIDQAQHKRDQAAIVLKVTPRAFGRGRPMPAAGNVTSLAADPLVRRPSTPAASRSR
jgi:NAD+ synthase (glutamine-hydrolysing)